MTFNRKKLNHFKVYPYKGLYNTNNINTKLKYKTEITFYLTIMSASNHGCVFSLLYLLFINLDTNIVIKYNSKYFWCNINMYV